VKPLNFWVVASGFSMRPCPIRLSISHSMSFNALSKRIPLQTSARLRYPACQFCRSHKRDISTCALTNPFNDRAPIGISCILSARNHCESAKCLTGKIFKRGHYEL
jgi:hypothetical protein